MIYWYGLVMLTGVIFILATIRRWPRDEWAAWTGITLLILGASLLAGAL